MAMGVVHILHTALDYVGTLKAAARVSNRALQAAIQNNFIFKTLTEVVHPPKVDTTLPTQLGINWA